ncbi:hypothetical protein [Streptomyces sp. ODS28]|uniref:hypothetical protein n=1 Tax=Streptomyces sp. ODS28 TaxID=3136688 RepID=UPI0031EE9D0B
MPVCALALAALYAGFEHYVEMRFGAAGIVGCLLLGVGIEARNMQCGVLGAAVLALLLFP